MPWWLLLQPGRGSGAFRWLVAGAGSGESVEEVADRFLSLLSRLEQQHSNHTVLLVAHGDTLSIGTAAVRNRADMRNHKQSFYLGTAEMLKLA